MVPWANLTCYFNCCFHFFFLPFRTPTRPSVVCIWAITPFPVHTVYCNVSPPPTGLTTNKFGVEWCCFIWLMFKFHPTQVQSGSLSHTTRPTHRSTVYPTGWCWHSFHVFFTPPTHPSLICMQGFFFLFAFVLALGLYRYIRLKLEVNK